MVLNKDFREFIALLNAKEVKSKLNAGRPQDKVDAEKLKEQNKKPK